jgi:hypothetical protein
MKHILDYLQDEITLLVQEDENCTDQIRKCYLKGKIIAYQDLLNEIDSGNITFIKGKNND